MPQRSARRRRYLATAAFVGVVFATACTSSETTATPNGPGGPETPTAGGNDDSTGDYPRGVDPQVLSDVVAGVFMMPGDTARRTILARHRIRSLANVECGGEPFDDLGSTAARYNQARFADLELIAEKGLGEIGGMTMAEAEEQVQRVDLWECEFDVLESYWDWHNLQEPWHDIVLEADEQPAVVATKQGTAHCLRTQSGVGIDIDDARPTETYLSGTDLHYQQGDFDDLEVERQRLSDVYVECTGDYFEALEAELRPRRDQMVERNRELLERFAGEVAEAGYVP